MAELLARVTRRRASLHVFNKEALNAFILGRFLKQLSQSGFYRVQAQGDSLAEFVQRLREAARVLMIQMTEHELVQFILEGVTPQERSMLVFAERPRSFSDLDNLCVISRTFQSNDNSRTRPAPLTDHTRGPEEYRQPIPRDAPRF